MIWTDLATGLVIGFIIGGLLAPFLWLLGSALESWIGWR